MSEDASWEDLEMLRDKLRMQAYEQAKSYIRCPGCGCTQGHYGHCTVYFAHKQSVENVCEHGTPMLEGVHCDLCMIRDAEEQAAWYEQQEREADIKWLKEMRIKW